MRRCGIMLAVAMAVGAGAAESREAQLSPLDGTRWAITMTPDEAAEQAGEKPSDDILMFEEGRMVSSECMRYGFETSPYSGEQVDGQITFETEQESRKEGTMQWSGQATDKAIKGTVVWKKRKGKPLNYQFEGKPDRS